VGNTLATGAAGVLLHDHGTGVCNNDAGNSCANFSTDTAANTTANSTTDAPSAYIASRTSRSI